MKNPESITEATLMARIGLLDVRWSDGTVYWPELDEYDRFPLPLGYWLGDKHHISWVGTRRDSVLLIAKKKGLIDSHTDLNEIRWIRWFVVGEKR